MKWPYVSPTAKAILKGIAIVLGLVAWALVWAMTVAWHGIWGLF